MITLLHEFGGPILSFCARYFHGHDFPPPNFFVNLKVFPAVVNAIKMVTSLNYSTAVTWILVAYYGMTLFSISLFMRGLRFFCN